jgi:hypothetical protein
VHNYYEDILKLTKKKPLWFDESGVPRYVKFAPNRLANIYAKEACLFLISCQSCGHKFHVAASQDIMDYGMGASELSTQIRSKSLHYGDPPNIRCCEAGPTMNCIDHKVLEYWARQSGKDWKRNKKLELDIEDDEEVN